jgi:hypothetical protein
MKQLANIAKVTPKRMSRLWLTLAACFPEHRNPRLEKEREKCEEIRQKRQASGSLGGKAKQAIAKETPSFCQPPCDSITQATSHISQTKAAVGDTVAYVRTCVQALNQGMAENETVAGEWMPVSTTTQHGRVSWCEDRIPLAVVEKVVYERAKAFRSTPRNRGPHSLKYFDAAVREAWEGTEFERGKDEISEALDAV